MERTATLWFAVALPERRAAALSGTLAGLEGAFGAGRLGDGLAVELAARFGTPAAAARAQAALTHAGPDLQVPLSLTGAEVVELGAVLRPLLERRSD